MVSEMEVMASDGEMVGKKLPKFPPGFRFVPTDEELIREYLLPKLANQKLPYDIINDTNVYDLEPQELVEKYKEYGKKKWYFFTSRERKYSNGSRPDRTVKKGIGFWKLTGADKIIKQSETILRKRKVTEEADESVKKGGKILGRKKVLVYYVGNGRINEKTDWIMYEYIAHSEKDKVEKTPNCTNKLDACVLCVIKKKGAEEKESSRAASASTSMAFYACNGNNTSMAPPNHIPLQNSQCHQVQPTITDSQFQVCSTSNLTHDYVLGPNVAANGAIGGSGTPDYSSSMVLFNHQAAQNTEDHCAMVATQEYYGTGSVACIAPNNSQNLQNTEGYDATFDLLDKSTVEEVAALLLPSPPRPGGISELFVERNNEGLEGEGQGQISVSDYAFNGFQYNGGNDLIEPWKSNTSHEVPFDPRAKLPPKS